MTTMIARPAGDTEPVLTRPPVHAEPATTPTYPSVSVFMAVRDEASDHLVRVDGHALLPPGYLPT